MVTIASNTQTETEIVDALKANGLEPVETEAPAKEAKPVVEDNQSEPSGEPGEKVPAETEGKTAAEPDAAGEKSQETAPPEGTTPKDKDKDKPKGGYQAKIEKLTRRIEEIQERLEEEAGSKSALRAERDELAAKLAELQPAEPEKEPDLVRPTRPKAPRLKDFDFDADKFEAAQETYDQEFAKYEEDLDKYNAEVRAREREEDRRKDAEARQKQEQEANVVRTVEQFEARRKKEEHLYEDYAELRDALPANARTIIDESPVVLDYVMKESEHPVHLVHFFMKDLIENDGAEGERIAKLPPIKQVLEVAKIEAGLIRENKAASKEKSGEAGEAPAAVTPAKELPKRVETPEEPIRPVGSRAATGGAKNLDQQMREAAERGDNKKFQELLAQQHREKNAVSV